MFPTDGEPGFSFGRKDEESIESEMNLDRRSLLVGLVGAGGAGATLQLLRGGDPPGSATGGSPVAESQPVLRLSGSGPIRSVSLAQVPLGGGGFVTGIDISKDGQRFVCRTDVANAYVRDARDGFWRPMFSPTTMQQGDYDPLPGLNGKADGQGVAGICIAPSNKDIIVASFYGFVWKTVDGGRSIRRTRLAQKSMPANAGLQRLYNPTIDIHPRDPNQILVGTTGDGVWFTTDGGAKWGRAKLPETGKSIDEQPGINLVLFDARNDKRVYVFVTGSGLYCSDDGPGGSFRLLAGGPVTCANLVQGADNRIYVCEQLKGQAGQLWSHLPGSGWNAAKLDHEAAALAADPLRPTRLVACDSNGYFMVSDDGGNSWQSIGGAEWSASSGEVGWTRELTTMFPAQIKFDPVGPNRLWIAQGVGVARALVAGPKYRMDDWSAGIEELCTVAAVSPPGGATVVSALDKPFWRIDHIGSYSNDFRYPVASGGGHDPDLVTFGSFLDFAGDDSKFLAGIVGTTGRSGPGYSSDGGRTWTAFDDVPTTGWGQGGCIAASTKNNIVLLPSNNGTGIYTLDGGKTWSPISLDGAKPTSGFANAYYVARKNLTADKTRPGTFALVYTVIRNGNSYGEPLGGVWVTRDGGRTWTQVLQGVISAGSHDPRVVRASGADERQFWQCQLDYVPGRPRELIYTPHSDYKSDPFYWSKDDGQNWSEFDPNIRNVSCFGFGKAPPGQSRPAVYFWGALDGKDGLYGSWDWFQTAPRLITRFPSQMLAKPSFVAGTPDELGRIYVGTSCAGVIRVDVAM
jgi:photosystem II stability/assembly factor-like uncharacterized protein